MKRMRTIWKRLLPVLIVLAVLGMGLFLLLRDPVHLEDQNSSIWIGYEGLRVKRVMQALDLGETTGMGGAYYDEQTANAVAAFQEENGLNADGRVDLRTWKALGLTKGEWDLCGTYHSPKRTGLFSSRVDRIEAMIDRAYDYLGDPYVIGASGPPGASYGLDCSGLVIQALYAAGVALSDINPVTHAKPGHEYESRNLWNSGYFTKVPYEERERGDLVFYVDGAGIVIHVAIYLGDNQVIEAWPDEVQVSDIVDGRHPLVVGLKRVF